MTAVEVLDPSVTLVRAPLSAGPTLVQPLDIRVARVPQQIGIRVIPIAPFNASRDQVFQGSASYDSLVGLPASRKGRVNLPASSDLRSDQDGSIRPCQ